MKVYMCDSCNIMTLEPYVIQAKGKFYVELFDEECNLSKTWIKRKRKIHLCHSCFKGLKSIADNLRKETS